MAAYLLDTSALIDWLGGVPSVRQLMHALTDEGHRLAVCCVSLAELYSGLAEHERPVVDRVIEAMEYWHIGPDAAKLAGHYRYVYSRQGLQLSAPDALLAALAIAEEAHLVTGNVKDFPMPELKLEPLPA
ncbi:MAG: PIN domain-containing protein [Chloroflexota bacterium]|nr:PIN domain-containing protein [Chloroflexota bacterium]